MIDTHGTGDPSILITRLSALGDCIQTLPVACAIKRQTPGARITWLTQSGPASLLAGHPCLDEVITVPRGWLKSPSQWWRLRRQLRRLNCDVAIDGQSLTKSSAAAWLSGATRRIGFARPVGREIAPWLDNIRLLPQKTHVVDQYLELLRPLGIHDPHVEFCIPHIDAVDEAARILLRQLHLGEHQYVVINPGAGWPSKVWPAARFARVAKTMGQRWQVPSLVVWWGDQERAWAEQIVEQSGGQAILAPVTPLPLLTSLIRRAAAFLGSDTGPLHLAAAVGTRCVGLYGPTSPQRCGPYGAAHVCLESGMPARFLQRRSATNAAMLFIEVAEVLDACVSLFQSTQLRNVA